MARDEIIVRFSEEREFVVVNNRVIGARAELVPNEKVTVFGLERQGVGDDRCKAKERRPKIVGPRACRSRILFNWIPTDIRLDIGARGLNEDNLDDDIGLIVFGKDKAKTLRIR